MPVTLGTNIASLRSQRRLFNNSEQLSSVFQRLSSGQRINKASDDAAGLAIADDLNAKSRIFTQGVRNLNDGLSLFNIADSGLENLTSIVTRLEELAEQAANGVYGPKQRKAIDLEAQELKAEFFRISKTTEFNGQSLFAGEFNQLNLQGGIGDDAVLSLGVGGAIGTGEFENSSSSVEAESSRSYSIAVGDLDGDGIMDIISAGSSDTNDGYATVRLGAGSGSFQDPTSFQTEAGRSYALALGDLNGDGILDLVTAGRDDSLNGYTTVRLGTGTGSFAEATSFQTETRWSKGVALGDLNGDGILDLVTAGQTDGNAGYATVRLGLGNGSFAGATSFQSETNGSYAVALNDLNGDGVLDLITAGRSSAPGASGVATIRLGDGTGSFSDATSFVTESGQSRALAMGDLNSDGILDLVTAGLSDSQSGSVTVRLGTGTGAFSSGTSYDTESKRSAAVSLGDLNGDGILDLVTGGASDGDDGYATVRIGTGNGTFGEATSFQTEPNRTHGIALADLNGNGVLDIVTTGINDDFSQAYTTIRLGSSIDGVAPLLDFSLETMADARQALMMFTNKREQLTAQRGEIGANQSRLTVATAVLDVSKEMFTAAESRIRDADIAEESADLVRLNILQQATAAVLAQANTQPSLALQLLGGV